MNDDAFLNTEQYKSTELKSYTSITTLCAVSGIPRKLLKLAKGKACAGFLANGSIQWVKAKPAFEAMLPELLDQSSDDIGYWKKEIAKKDVALKELQIKKLEQNLIEPDEVKQLLVELATKQSVLLKRVFGELPPKLAGKSEVECKVILDEALKDIFSVLADKITKWK